MKIVPSADELPGTCALSGSSEGPFLQTGQLTRFDPGGQTQYVTVRHLIAYAAAVGCAPPARLERLTEEVDAVNQQLAEAHAEIERLRELERAVGYTLKNGAIAVKGEVKLRNIPGKKRIEV